MRGNMLQEACLDKKRAKVAGLMGQFVRIAQDGRNSSADGKVWVEG
jgi:hypothetical protein